MWRTSAGGQRFLFPGSSKAGKQDGGSSHALEQWPCPPSGSASRVTPTFEAGLEEVWSVRKNICTGVGTTQGGRGSGVGGGMVGGQLNHGKTSQQGVFSRHNPMSMAAQPAASHGRSVGAARSTSECGYGGRTLMQYIEDIIGPQLAVLYKEMFLFRRKICTRLYVVGTADSILIRERGSTVRMHQLDVCCLEDILLVGMTISRQLHVTWRDTCHNHVVCSCLSYAT